MATRVTPKGSAHLPAEAVKQARAQPADGSRIDAYVGEALSWLPSARAAAPAAQTAAAHRVLLADLPALFENPPRDLLKAAVTP